MYPEYEEVVQLSVYDHGEADSSEGLVPAEPDFPAVLRISFASADLATSLGLFPLSASTPVLAEVICFFFAVRAGLWNFDSVQDFIDSHLLDGVESTTCSLEVNFQR